MSRVRPFSEAGDVSRQIPAHLHEINISEDICNLLKTNSALKRLEGKYDEFLISEFFRALLKINSALERLDGKYDKSVILEITKGCVKKIGLPPSLIPEIALDLIKYRRMLNDELPEMEISSQKKKEHGTASRSDSEANETIEKKKEYKVYSHENSRDPQPATEDDIGELERRALEEDAFDIYFDLFKEEIIVNGRTKCFNPDNVMDGHKRVRLLEFVLKNVGITVYKRKLLDEVWLGDEIKDGSIRQALLRLSTFCDGKLSPFYNLKKTEDYETGETIVKLIIYQKKAGAVFKYCLVEKI
jgi:hypothetical protein